MAAPEQATAAQGGKQAPEPTRPRSFFAEWSVTIIMVLFVMMALVQSFVIPTISMEDTLLRGDHLLVDKLSYAPGGFLSRYLLPYTPIRRGDIIVFRWPIDIRQNYVKRVVGLPGDRIRIVNKQVYLNGKRIEEPYKYHKTAYFDSYRDNFPGFPNVRLVEPALAMLERNVANGELVVPPDNYFAMGDNRDNSSDSRYWGFVPRANIIGKPLVVFWSYDAPTEHLADPNLINGAHLLDLAKNFFRKTRWNRTMRFIHGYPIQ
jgi:signal peptidase I